MVTNITDITDEYIENKAAELGLKARVAVGGDVHVSSPFGGHWVIINVGDKYRIEHENYRLGNKGRRGTYHKHKERYPDVINAMEYIQFHDRRLLTRPLR